jgi:hypothetical protein
VFENYLCDIEVDGRTVELALWDTAGQEDYDRMRPLAYPNAHAVFICFTIDFPASLDNVQEKVNIPYDKSNPVPSSYYTLVDFRSIAFCKGRPDFPSRLQEGSSKRPCNYWGAFENF